MSKVGQNTVFKSGSVSTPATADQDLSEKCTNVAPTFNVSLHDVTPYGESWRKFIAGLKDGTCAVNMFADSDLDVLMFGLLGKLTAFQLNPYGDVGGETLMTFSAFIQSWALADPVDGAVTKTVNLQISGEVSLAKK